MCVNIDELVELLIHVHGTVHEIDNEYLISKILLRARRVLTILFVRAFQLVRFTTSLAN